MDKIKDLSFLFINLPKRDTNLWFEQLTDISHPLFSSLNKI